MNVKVSTHGQVTLPIALRRQFGITPGTHIAIEVDADKRHIVLTPITREYIHRLRGKYQGKGLMKALRSERQDETMREEKRFNRKARVL